MLTKAVFLDKDGTLVENVPYNVNPAKIRLTDGALEGLRLLHQAGFKIFVVSNQAGVAHGYFEEEALRGVEDRLRELLKAGGIPLAHFYYCPHHPDGKIERLRMTCFCRKPSPGMLFRAAREHQLNLADSWIIGDILDDIEAGRRADCRTILIDNGNETCWRMTAIRRPHATVRNLLQAADAIINTESQEKHGISQEIKVTVRKIPFRDLKIGNEKARGVSQSNLKASYERKPVAGD